MVMSPTKTLLSNEAGKNEYQVTSGSLHHNQLFSMQFLWQIIGFVWKLFKHFNDFMLILDQDFKADNLKEYE